MIEGLELWSPRDDRQRVLWPTRIQFSQRYFESLLAHAVPLNENAVARLSHSAMGLDIYTWLAQRLHRVEPGRAAFVPWVSLKEQFGHGYKRMRDFRRVFLITLKQVQVCLPGSSIHHGWKGDAPVPQLPAHPAQVRVSRLADDTEVVQNPRVGPLIHGHFVAQAYS